MKKCIFIFPHQLFEKANLLNKKMPVWLIEHPRFFTDFSYHKKKLILHKASMEYYKSFLKKKKKKVTYIPFEKAETKKLFKEIKKQKIAEIHCMHVADHELKKELEKEAKKSKTEIQWHYNPGFLSDLEYIHEYFDEKKQYRLHNFYKEQRKKYDILMTKSGKPEGGEWTYDEQNRKPLPNDIDLPTIKKARINSYIKNATKEIEKKFKKNPGEAENFLYPVTHPQAKTWFKNFLKKRFKKFGPYQDAIDTENHMLFHSILSPLLNCGLLTPKYVIEKSLSYAKKHSIPINSLEGFIRQILGWREFIFGIYIVKGEWERKQNYWNLKKNIPQSFWKAKTDIKPIDTTITYVLEHAYAHHIERLMVLGNFMLLCQFNPDSVYQWFMELFIDAYDWVMVPNVYGMSQFADGGLFASKPYISSSNYILKMSNYKKNDWADIWDGLYWHFIYTYNKKFEDQPRMAQMIYIMKRMKKATLKEHLSVAKKYLKKI